MVLFIQTFLINSFVTGLPFIFSQDDGDWLIKFESLFCVPKGSDAARAHVHGVACMFFFFFFLFL